ncbi:hypothetical protein EJ077_09250 [Mesorhizobium sp. M8A.F.Ca.ET.057.01.1.1]|nr:hypothetical protein EJ077_09250 [Mesorhizobium sp. M8A.F.Ca.ET.057.01.1.1]RWE46136.1 MAG: hypothetical protein EOS80_16210 [Mesorhizobium sp.]
MIRTAEAGGIHRSGGKNLSRGTPAMAAGVTDKLREIGDIVALIEANEAEKPMVRGPYKKRSEEI